MPMDNLAKKLESRSVVQGTARVESCDEADTYTLRDGAMIVVSARAASCVLKPAPGDEVLYASLSSGRCYVLAVLEKATPDESVWEARGNVALHLPEGVFSLIADGGVNVGTRGRAEIAAGEVHVEAGKASAVIPTVQLLAKFVGLDAEKVTSAAREVETVFDRWTQRAKNVYRFVEQLDLTRAGSVSQVAEGLMSLRAATTVVNAEQVVKIDAGQIHLG